MNTHAWRSPWLGLLLLAGLLAPGTVRGQEGFYLTPSFSVGEVFTDNVTAAPDHRVHDWVTRFTPGLEASYETGPFTALAGYNFDAEIFARNSEFNSTMARQRAYLDLDYLPAPPLTLSLGGEFSETRSPSELNVVTGFPSRRAQAHRFMIDPSLTYRFNPLTTGRLQYTFSDEDRRFGVNTLTHVGRVGIERRITGRDVLGLDYTMTQFHFRGTEEFVIARGTEILDTITVFPRPDLGEGDDTVRIHSIAPSWTRDLTPLTSFTVRAGPRFSEGTVDVDAFASVTRRLRQGEVTLAYSRAKATAVGEARAIDTDSVALTLRYNILPTLEVSATPAYFHNRRGGVKSDVYRFTLDATYAINRWLSLVGSYNLIHQRGLFLPPVVLDEADPGDLAAAGIRPNANITRNVVGLSLVAKFRTRLN